MGLNPSDRSWEHITAALQEISCDESSDEHGYLLKQGMLLLRETETCTVYCFGVPSGAKKIGRTNGAVQDRLASIQTGNHEELTTVASLASTIEGAFEIEREVHKRLDHCRIRGEWFNCEADEAIRAMKDAYGSFINRWWSFYLQNVGLLGASPVAPQFAVIVSPINGKVCVQCGKPFQAERIDSRYCSPACRLKAYRRKRQEERGE